MSTRDDEDGTGRQKLHRLPSVPIPKHFPPSPEDAVMLHDLLRGIEKLDDQQRSTQTELKAIKESLRAHDADRSERRGATRFASALAGAALSLALAGVGSGVWMYVQVHLIEQEMRQHASLAMHDGTRVAFEQRDDAISRLNIEIARLAQTTTQLQETLADTREELRRVRENQRR